MPGEVGDLVKFRPNPARPDFVEALVVDSRPDPRMQRSGRKGQGWLETRDSDGNWRSVRPSQCEVVKAACASTPLTKRPLEG